MSLFLSTTANSKMEAYWGGKLRGFMLKNSYDPNPHTAQDYADLGATGANVVRVPISLFNTAGRYPYPATEVAYVQQVLNAGTLNGFRVIVVMVPIAIGGDPSTVEYWASAQLRADITENWVQVARVIKNHPALIGYDLINEPVGPIAFDVTNKALWLTYSEAMCQALRAEDPSTPILWEPFWWGSPGSFWQYTRPPAVTNLVASFHWYEPGEVTSQGLPSYPAAGTQPYPVLGRDYSSGYSGQVEARNFAKNFSLPVFIGEYSCVRWAPVGSTEAYLTDAHKFFRAERWGSCFHAWRAYDGWDSEIAQSVPPDTGTAANRSSANPVITLLRNWFAAS